MNYFPIQIYQKSCERLLRIEKYLFCTDSIFYQKYLCNIGMFASLQIQSGSVNVRVGLLTCSKSMSSSSANLTENTKIDGLH